MNDEHRIDESPFQTWRVVPNGIGHRIEFIARGPITQSELRYAFTRGDIERMHAALTTRGDA